MIRYLIVTQEQLINSTLNFSSFSFIYMSMKCDLISESLDKLKHLSIYIKVEINKLLLKKSN